MIDTRFIVAKKRLEINLDLRNSESLDGNVFLHYAKDESGKPETPYDMLIDERKFIVFDLAGDGVCFINKDSILRLTYEEEEKTGDYSFNFSANIEVRMADGFDLQGKVMSLLPEESARLFDFLNTDEGYFILLHQDSNKRVIINKNEIDKIMII